KYLSKLEDLFFLKCIFLDLFFEEVLCFQSIQKLLPFHLLPFLTPQHNFRGERKNRPEAFHHFVYEELQPPAQRLFRPNAAHSLFLPLKKMHRFLRDNSPDLQPILDRFLKHNSTAERLQYLYLHQRNSHTIPQKYRASFSILFDPHRVDIAQRRWILHQSSPIPPTDPANAARWKLRREP